MDATATTLDLARLGLILRELEIGDARLRASIDLFRKQMVEVGNGVFRIETQLQFLASYFVALNGSLGQRKAFLATCQKALEGDDLEDIEATYDHLLRVQDEQRSVCLHVLMH